MSVSDEIQAVVHRQAQCWNAADIDGFMRSISPDVIYVTPVGLVRGRESLMEAYRGDWRNRPGGRLTVSVEEVLDHGDAATAIVRYWLSESADDRAGWSTLTFERSALGWRLTVDATMRSPSP